jgi:hypothetical protein
LPQRRTRVDRTTYIWNYGDRGRSRRTEVRCQDVVGIEADRARERGEIAAHEHAAGDAGQIIVFDGLQDPQRDLGDVRNAIEREARIEPGTAETLAGRHGCRLRCNSGRVSNKRPYR